MQWSINNFAVYPIIKSNYEKNLIIFSSLILFSFTTTKAQAVLDKIDRATDKADRAGHTADRTKSNRYMD